MPTPFSPDCKTIRSAQIIVLALIMGATMFGAIVALITFGGVGQRVVPPQGGNQGNQNLELILPIFGAVGAVLMIIAKPFVSSMLARKHMTQQKGVRHEDEMAWEETFRQLFLMKTIIGAAMLEGALFFNLTANMASQQVWPWVTVGVLYVLLFFQIPTQLKAERWLRDNLRRARDEGLMSGSEE